MRDVEQTIGNLIDKQGVSFISSVDAEGFPNTKAMLPPRRRDGIKTYYVTDPDYCVLRFIAEKGRFYSNFNSESFEITDPDPLPSKKQEA